MPYDRGIACLHEHNCDVLSIDHYCGHLTLLIAFRGSFFSVNSHLDMLSNKSFSQKLLSVRRKYGLFWIRWFRLTDTAEIYLLLVAGPGSNEDRISVEHPCYSIICLCRSGSLSCRMAGEKALLRVFGCLLGLSKLSHLIAQHGDMLVVAFGQARF